MPELPGRLQAVFVPAESAMAWWGVTDLEPAVREHGLPEGRPSTCRLALPDGDRAVPATVAIRLAELDDALPALSALDPDRPTIGASMRAWRVAATLPHDADDAFAELGARMPTAAHALLGFQETTIFSASALLGRFRQTVATHTALRSTSIRAELRPYQIHGVAWLRSVPGLGGGAILADEMGLGKTLQAICLLATRPPTGPHLVVCPTSLIGNWQRELARFAPDTPVIGYHGSRRTLPDSLPPGSVVVTSYPMLRADGILTETKWDVAIFDEAQQIKNPDALVSKAANRLSAEVRIAMTGTPVENHLEELWSILNVTSPGLLGSRARFRQRFAAPIEQRRSATAAAALNALVAPRLLRRTKSEVATELPAKQYSTIVCTVTEEQSRLYREAVDRAFTEGFGGGIGRRGRILALLTSLKQICNHPAQFLREETATPGRSGKFDRATEMLAEIVEERDRALVFTQYRAMGELLSGSLSATLGTGRIPFLHGGLSLERRDRLVRAFQEDDDAPPVLLLSLRAAGFGLNLTRATHVMHYDRWWNPAVEEQATDRAHRIGQDRTLNVHTLVTGGTIEDHIAQMHDTKRGLADIVSGNTEAALADLSDEQLHAVLDLDLGALT
ncbi:serine/threonine protein kinase [Embleya scabrispora]|uniref:Serine/threonine protein kinase n=1 Tax=Embleya scabrispora TaxID=159449 RepID=A0A1T3NW60_9ACTN|nr:DEAD/DEAH box helicase [Embleya scabrispora]OPC81024.1 serine/threonine protein kinase [Embleya scabrispora]